MEYALEYATDVIEQIQSTRDWIDFVTLGIAITALVQPWLWSLYKKMFNKPKLECFVNKNATLSFNYGGISFESIVTMISKKQESVIKGIEIEISKAQSPQDIIYKMNWEHLSFTYKRHTYSMNHSSSETTSFPACPTYLMKDNPLSYTISFVDERVRNNFMEIWARQKDANQVQSSLLDDFHFQAGEHRLTLMFVSIDGSKKLFYYKFNLSVAQIDLLKSNAIFMANPQNVEQLRGAYIELTEERKKNEN